VRAYHIERRWSPAASALRTTGSRAISAFPNQITDRPIMPLPSCELLTQLPPNPITRAEVARNMSVDPSLIRYYFRDRSMLLLAAVARFMHGGARTIRRDGSCSRRPSRISRLSWVSLPHRCLT
jgi:hypothetical protein